MTLAFAKSCKHKWVVKDKKRRCEKCNAKQVRIDEWPLNGRWVYPSG